jgi:hypothetical protein
MTDKEKLSSIQWITNSTLFNEYQHIQLGDAIAAFHDCIEQRDEALELLRECRDMLIFYDNDHTTKTVKKLDKFLGDA